MRSMSDRVDAAEQIVQDLSRDELSEFASWFAEFHSRMWDAEIERDSAVGCFDEMIARAHKEFEAGLARPACQF